MARDLIAARLDAAGLAPSLVETFPFRAVVELAFRAAGFWVVRAAAWLPHIEFDQSFADVLRRFTLDKQRPQSDRHLVAKHLHTWEADRALR